MTAKPLDMSFDALSLRDSGLSSPVDQHHQYGQYQNNQNNQNNRRFSQYGSERGPSSPLTRKPTNGSQRNSSGSGSVRGDSKDMKRQSSRMSLANVVSLFFPISSCVHWMTNPYTPFPPEQNRNHIQPGW